MFLFLQKIFNWPLTADIPLGTPSKNLSLFTLIHIQNSLTDSQFLTLWRSRLKFSVRNSLSLIWSHYPFSTHLLLPALHFRVKVFQIWTFPKVTMITQNFRAQVEGEEGEEKTTQREFLSLDSVFLQVLAPKSWTDPLGLDRESLKCYPGWCLPWNQTTGAEAETHSSLATTLSFRSTQTSKPVSTALKTSSLHAKQYVSWYTQSKSNAHRAVSRGLQVSSVFKGTE